MGLSFSLSKLGMGMRMRWLPENGSMYSKRGSIGMILGKGCSAVTHSAETGYWELMAGKGSTGGGGEGGWIIFPDVSGASIITWSSNL